MPSSVIVAMRKAVDLVLKEGLQNRYRRHAKAATQIREGLKGMGLEIFTESGFLSNTVSVAKVSEEWSSSLRKTLQEKHDIMVADGLEELQGKIIRIGHMGTSATPEAISATLEGLEDCLAKVTA